MTGFVSFFYLVFIPICLAIYVIADIRRGIERKWREVCDQEEMKSEEERSVDVDA